MRDTPHEHNLVEYYETKDFLESHLSSILRFHKISFKTTYPHEWHSILWSHFSTSDDTYLLSYLLLSNILGSFQCPPIYPKIKIIYVRSLRGHSLTMLARKGRLVVLLEISMNLNSLILKKMRQFR